GMRQPTSPTRQRGSRSRAGASGLWAAPSRTAIWDPPDGDTGWFSLSPSCLGFLPEVSAAPGKRAADKVHRRAEATELLKKEPEKVKSQTGPGAMIVES